MRRLLAVQGQDVVAPLMGIAARTDPLAPRSRIDAASASGALVRTWAVRGTLHVVAAEDVGWLLALTGARMLASTRTVRAREGIGEAELVRAAGVVEGLPGTGLLRPELLGAFAAAGVDPGGSRGYHLILALAAQGLLHVGPREGGQYRLHRSAGALPAAPALEQDEALARLAVRYLRGHGPAGDADLAKWAGLPVIAARRGIAAAGGALEAVEIEGAPAWVVADASGPADPGAVHALPAFDELVVGYAARGPALRDLPLAAIAPGSNGRFLPVVVADGRVVGTWDGRDTPLVAPLIGLEPRVLALAESAAARLVRWAAP